jgi:hypothetical protein
VVEDPGQKELRGERRHREVEPLDPQARQAERDPDQRGDQPGQDQADGQRQFRNAQHEVVRGVGAHGHEPAGAQRQLTGVAREEIEAEGRQREHQELGQDRPEDVLVAEDRNDHKGDEQQGREPVLVLNDREDFLIGGIGRLELAGFAVDHALRPFR